MIAIRRAVREDVPSIVALVRALAAYEREPDAVVATEEDYLRDGFGDAPAFHVHVATEGGEVVGFALWFFTWSTWRGRRCLHLEDLFVLPEHRKKGAGLALMRALAGEAVAAGCARFVWQVLDWNEPAIAFYEKLGATVLREWVPVRIDGDALAGLARAK
ncbi:MAG TPA: GNAT family N-acetyltransferase [Polyangiaceae bacterium]|jgi:GNAT superfamily N-acetyltransferase